MLGVTRTATGGELFSVFYGQWHLLKVKLLEDSHTNAPAASRSREAPSATGTISGVFSCPRLYPTRTVADRLLSDHTEEEVVVAGGSLSGFLCAEAQHVTKEGHVCNV